MVATAVPRLLVLAVGCQSKIIQGTVVHRPRADVAPPPPPRAPQSFQPDLQLGRNNNCAPVKTAVPGVFTRPSSCQAQTVRGTSLLSLQPCPSVICFASGRV